MATFSILPLTSENTMLKKLDKLVLPQRLFVSDLLEMAKDLEENGQKEPILVKGNHVVDGVVRCLAAKSLGWEEIMVQI